MYPVSVYLGMFIQFLTTITYLYWVWPSCWGFRWRVRCWFVFFFKRINTEENPFLFVTTPARTSHGYYFCIFVHNVPQRCKTCQLAEFRSVDPSCSEMLTIQRQPNVKDNIGPILYKCHRNVLCLLESHYLSMQSSTAIFKFATAIDN